MEPALIATALNGARRGKSDHPALPLALDEIIAEARACHDRAGGSATPTSAAARAGVAAHHALL